MDELRASFAEQEKRVEEIMRTSKIAQKELVDALHSADAALREGALLREKMTTEYVQGSRESFSKKDQARIAKLTQRIEEKIGPRPDSSEVLESLNNDELIEKVSGVVQSERRSEVKHKSAHGVAKQGHIAL